MVCVVWFAFESAGSVGGVAGHGQRRQQRAFELINATASPVPSSPQRQMIIVNVGDCDG